MKLQFLWDTGDYFTADPVYPEFVDWYVQTCVMMGNNFERHLCTGQETFKASDVEVSALIIELQENLASVNKIIRGLGLQIYEPKHSFYDQRELNRLHKHWVKWIREDPQIQEKFRKLGREDQFRGINYLSHHIESSFKYRMVTAPIWKAPNKFKDLELQDGLYNITMNYAEKGKSSHHKWRGNDDQPNDYELSNWENAVGSLNFQLDSPKVFGYNTDYIDYCDRHNIPKTTLFYPIANINDADQLAHARQVMDINMFKKGNALSLRLL